MTAFILENKRSIALQTAEGTNIPNEQHLEIDGSELQKLRVFERDYGSQIKFRANPTGIYNCHGLTFASRRTFIYDANFLQTILNDDSYIEIDQKDTLGGDVILYFIDSLIEHSGIVVEAAADTLLNIPKVCSKWGFNAEFIHYANNSPYGHQYRFYRVNLKYEPI